MMQQQQQTGDWGPINMVISYAYEDQHLFKELRTHLVSLERALDVRVWDVSQLTAGEDRQQSITKHLNTADIILLLVSPDFLASDFTFDLTKRAIERYENSAARVIPIFLRPAAWLSTPLGNFQSLPSSGRPIISSRDRDEAWFDVAENIRRVCEEILSSRLSSPSKSPVENLPASPTTVESQRAVYKFTEVFVKSGFPYITFVKHNSLKKLKYIIDTPGRGVIIEGPSGIGKTTAVEEAMKELGLGRMKYLSARNQQDLPLIQTLEQWHQGIVVIDDFHHLDISLHQRMVDYLKYLADISSSTKKIVLIGIPHTHQRLVKLSFDLATRIDVFNMTRVDNNTVQQMIEKGEEALNIRFDRKSEIISAANGSLNIAQYICWHICFAEDVERTSQEALPQSVRCEVNTAVGDVMDELSIKFGDTLRYFAELGGHKNSTTLRLLEELAKCEDGFLPLLHLKSKRSDLASGIERFINERWIEILYQKHSESQKQLFFDQMGTALVVDDPELIFYLKYFTRTPARMVQLTREIGKAAALTQRKVFISYSHQDDAQWLKRLQTHLRPLEQEGIIDLWSDTKIAAGSLWQDKIQEALETAKVALLLVSANFLASDFIKEHELPTLLSSAASGGTSIMSLILSPCSGSFKKSGLDIFQTINPPNQPLTSLDYNGQEQYLAQTFDEVSAYLETDEA